MIRLQYVKAQWPTEFIGKWVPIQTVRESPGQGDRAIVLIGNMNITCFDDIEHGEIFLKQENERRKTQGRYEIKCEFVQITETYPMLSVRVHMLGNSKEELIEEEKTKVSA